MLAQHCRSGFGLLRSVVKHRSPDIPQLTRHVTGRPHRRSAYFRRLSQSDHSKDEAAIKWVPQLGEPPPPTRPAIPDPRLTLQPDGMPTRLSEIRSRQRGREGSRVRQPNILPIVGHMRGHFRPRCGEQAHEASLASAERARYGLKDSARRWPRRLSPHALVGHSRRFSDDLCADAMQRKVTSPAMARSARDYEGPRRKLHW